MTESWSLEWDGGGEVGEGVGGGWIKSQFPKGIRPFSLISSLPLPPPTVAISQSKSLTFSGTSSALQTFAHAVPSARSTLSAPYLPVTSHSPVHPWVFRLEVNFSRKLSAVGIFYLAYATFVSSGSENSISVFLWGATASPALIHGVQIWAPGSAGEPGQWAYPIPLATVIGSWMGTSFQWGQWDSLEFCWNCWERGFPFPLGLPVTRIKQAWSCFWPSLAPCAESLSESKSKTEESRAERWRERWKKRQRHIFFDIESLESCLKAVLHLDFL